MGDEDEPDTNEVVERTPSDADIRCNTLTFSRQFWPYHFALPYIPDPGRNLASVGMFYGPAEFAALDGIFDTQCIVTHEPLILLGYMFRNGMFLDPEDPRILIGKEVGFS
jgi:hypothetical protein